MGHHRKMGDFLEDLILLIVGVTLRINLTIIQSLSGDLRERHALLRKFGIGIKKNVSCSSQSTAVNYIQKSFRNLGMTK